MEWLRAISGLASLLALAVAVALLLLVLHAAPAFSRSASRRRAMRRWLPAVDAVVILIALFTALAFTTGERTPLLVAAGIGVALALWSLRFALDDFASGIVLQAEGTIEPEGWVRVAGLEGRVRRIGLRSIVLETEHGERVVVPFGTAARSAVITSVASDQTRAHTFSVVAPIGMPPERAAARLRTAAYNSIWSSVTRDPEIELRSEDAAGLHFDVTVHALSEDRIREIERDVRQHVGKDWDASM